MSIVIQVENLSKKYILNHEERSRYSSLREELTKNVRKAFTSNKKSNQSKETFYALSNINFEINRGDRVGIIGRNGAGKSTLLKILSRITEPSSGRITIDGRIASLLEVGTGFHPELTGRENIFLNGSIYGMKQSEIRRKFDEIVDFAEVEKFLDTPVKRYSSGMYVRLAFAVAAYLEPEILIVDEVLAVGDVQFQKKCLGKMHDVSKDEGRTILFVSHNMGVVSQLCQKSILLNSGKMVMAGDTRDVIDYYLLKKEISQKAYIAPESNRIKEIFIEKAETYNVNMRPSEDFRSDEAIYLILDIKTAINHPNAMISVTIQNNNGDYLTTFVESLSDFAIDKGLHKLKIEIQGGVITPNTYAFRVAIFIPNSFVYDLVDMVCPFRIIDVGSKMAMFEGINYGSFFIGHKTTLL